MVQDDFVRHGQFNSLEKRILLFFDAFEHDFDAAGADHPFEPVIAIFALEQSAFHRIIHIGHAGDDIGGGFRGFRDGGTRVCARDPFAELRAPYQARCRCRARH